MGKPTGFLEYERQENEAIQPLSRITNFNEFHPFLDEETRRKQGARCMNCGVPFCQSAIKLKDTLNKLGYKAKINTHTTSYIN